MRPIVPSTMLSLALVACVGESPTSEDVPDDLAYLPVVRIPDTYQQIGVVDGAPEYQLFRVTGATRLSGGNIVVANSGTSQLRFFGPDGRFLFSTGGYGGGPGEFRSLKGVYEVARDTILAFDEIGRTSFFNADGQFLYSANVMLSDNRFPMDVWLYRMNWVEGVPDVLESRLSAAEALDLLPPPNAWPWYHNVRIDPARNMWVGIDRDGDGHREFWTVYARNGAPFVRVILPDRFRMTKIETTEIIGVWRDVDDIEFIRTYPLTLPSAMASESVTPVDPETSIVSDSTNLDEARRNAYSLLRTMVAAQEIYFSHEHTYTPDVFDLDLEIPERSGIDLLEVRGTGWLAVFIHRDQPGICAIGLGSTTPAGWREGVPTCSQLTAEDIRNAASR